MTWPLTTVRAWPLLLALVAAPAPGAGLAFERDTLWVRTQAGALHRFEVELALDAEQHERGLMFRRSLGAAEGMLFDYGTEQRVGMWMANTYVALDMLFIAGDGTVRRIEPDTEPLSQVIIDSGGPVRAVLELPAGTAARLGFAPGDQVLHATFGSAPVAPVPSP